jgi:hypothetical protein
MNFKKIYQAVALQKKANYQIETYGRATEDVVDLLMEITDSFTAEEASEFIVVYEASSQEDDFYLNEQVDLIRNK